MPNSMDSVSGMADSRQREEEWELPSGVSVVVPCYKSTRALEQLVDQLVEVLPECTERFEVILVNDSDEDETWRVIERICKRLSSVVGVCLMRNYGQHNATLCGVRRARYASLVTIDDDLQQSPADIPKLLGKLHEGNGLVYGVAKRRTQSLYRHLLSRFLRLAISLAFRQPVLRDLSAFRAFRTSLRRAFEDFRGPEVYLDVLLAWGTTRIETIPVNHQPRRVGKSNYGFLSMANMALRLWTGYTTVPLRLATLVGFVSIVFGIGSLAYVLGAYFWYGTLPGFTFLASTIAIFGGVQMLTLGIIGEYLARMFGRSLDRPAYVVRRVADCGKGSG